MDTEISQSAYTMLNHMTAQQSSEHIDFAVVPMSYHNVRRKLVDWIWETLEEFGMANPTIHLSVRIMDKFNSTLMVDQQYSQLGAMASMIIACKLEESAPPALVDFRAAADNEFSEHHIMEMELMVLRQLSWNVNMVTSAQFAGLLLSVCAESQFPDSMVHLRNYTAFYLDLAAQDTQVSLSTDPSLIALAAFSAARWQLGYTPMEEELYALMRHEQRPVERCFEVLLECYTRTFGEQPRPTYQSECALDYSPTDITAFPEETVDQ